MGKPQFQGGKGAKGGKPGFRDNSGGFKKGDSAGGVKKNFGGGGKKKFGGGGSSKGKQRAGGAASSGQRKEKLDPSLLPPAKPLKDMNIDEFLDQGFEDIVNESDESGSDNDDAGALNSVLEKSKSVKKGKKPIAKEEDEDGSEDLDGLVPEDMREHRDALQESVSNHKSQLEKLKESDPDFYKFLQENDQNLLDFSDEEGDLDLGDEEDDDEGDEDDEEVDDEEIEGDDDSEVEFPDEEFEDDELESMGKKTKKRASHGLSFEDITIEAIAEIEEQLKTSPKAGIKALVSALKMAVAEANPEEDVTSSSSKGKKGKKKAMSADDLEEEGATGSSKAKRAAKMAAEAVNQKLKMLSSQSKVFNKVLRLALAHVPSFLSAAFADVPKTYRDIKSSKKLRSLQSITKSFLKSVLALLSMAADEEMLTTILQAASNIMFLAPYCGVVARKLLKTLIVLWSTANPDTRVHAFLGLRQIALSGSVEHLAMCLKGTYLAYVRHCKFTTPSSYPSIAFMENCLVELFLIDEDSAYQHGFVYIRQLGIHLRNALTQKTKSTFAGVYNWQYVHCLRVWARIIGGNVKSLGSSSSASDGLKPLIYPLVQITMGVVKLIPTPRFYPLRFHCIESLLELASSCRVLIPLSPLIFDPLIHSEVTRQPKKVGKVKLNMDTMLKIPKTIVGTKLFQDTVIDKIYELGLRFFAAYGHSIAFPEFIVPTKAFLAKAKKSKNAKLGSVIKQLVEKLDENAAFISRRRSTAPFSPSNTTELRAWTEALIAEDKTPLVKFYNSWAAIEVKRKAALRNANAKEKDEEIEDDESDFDDADVLNDPPMPKSRSKKFDDDDDDDDDDDEEGDEEDDDDEKVSSKKSSYGSKNNNTKSPSNQKLGEKKKNDNSSSSKPKKARLRLDQDDGDVVDKVKDFDLKSFF